MLPTLLRGGNPIEYFLASLSPDTQTVLSVGDSSEVFLHHVSGGAKLTFTPITTLTLPRVDGLPFWLPSNALVASFSTAFSADGTKFAIASQEGVVAVWDVRSTKPIKVFQTDKTTGCLQVAPRRLVGAIRPPVDGYLKMSISTAWARFGLLDGAFGTSSLAEASGGVERK